MDVRIEHEVSGRTIRAEVYGIAPGTSLHRVTDALRAVIDRGEETRKSLQDKVDDLKSLLKVEQEKLAASVKKHKATSRRLSTANKKLRNLDQ
jgi:predicted RNA-binding Zn ribbon-like protein